MLAPFPAALRRAALTLALALAVPLAAQGYSYDLTTTVTRANRATGQDTTLTFLRARGQFAKGVSRLDFVETMSRSAMMARGNYMISNSITRKAYFVDPGQHQYVEYDLADVSSDASDRMKNAPNGISMRVSDVHANMESLGAGEKMEGFSTLRYRLTERYTMDLTIMGSETHTPTASTTDIWIAPALDALMNPSARPDLGQAADATGTMAPLTNATTRAYSNVKPGVVMKRVNKTVSTEGGKPRTSSATTVITNVKKASIPASVFEVPSGYTRVEPAAPVGPPR